MTTPYERVQLSRQRTDATFPLPSVLDCIRYAITELAEYDDALLRAERTGDKRNNDKAHDPRAELGQALYMLLSAYVQWSAEPDIQVDPPRGVWEQWLDSTLYFSAMGELAQVADNVYCLDAPDVPLYERSDFEKDVLWRADDAFNCMYNLALKRGWDADALIDETCARFEAKHAPAREVR